MRKTLIIIFIWALFIMGCNSPAISTCKKIINSVEKCNIDNFKILVYLNISEEDSISNMENFKEGCELLKNGTILQDSSYYYDILKINTTAWQETYYINVANKDKNVIGNIEIKFINAAGFEKAIALNVNYFGKGLDYSPKIEIDESLLDSDFIPNFDSAVLGKFPENHSEDDIEK